MEEKTCRTCSSTLPLEEFYYHKVRKKYSLDCKACHRAKVKDKRVAARSEIVLVLKDGSTERFTVLTNSPVIGAFLAE